MSLPRWIVRLAQQWLPRGVKTTRRRMHPCLEVLEDRLTPSGDVLAFTTAAYTTFYPGQPSPTITVQLQDGSGKAVTATSTVTINLSSTSSGGQFLDTSGMALSHPSLTIPKGASSASFEYKDTQEGLPTLEAKASALNLAASQQEAVAVRLNVGTSSSYVGYTQIGQPSASITVELVGLSGPFRTHGALTVPLTSSSSTGQFLDESGKPLSNGLLTIPAGSYVASFEYKDSQASISNLTASLDGSQITIPMDVGTSLVFSTPAQTLKAGQLSGTITLQLQDGHGKAVLTPSKLGLFLNSNSLTGKLLDTSGNPMPFPFLSIPAGASSFSFKYEDSVGGKPTLTADSSSGFEMGLSSAKQQETVVGPYNLVLGMPGRSIAQNEVSQPITIQLHDSTGMAVTATSAVAVQLSSSSPTGQFFDGSGNVLSSGRLSIPAGASSATFEYKDSHAGLPTLKVSANGSTSQAQVNVGTSLVFASPAQTLKAGQTSGTITVQLQDSHGKAVIAPGIVPIYVTSNSQTGHFLDSSGNPVPYPSFDIPAGASSFSFKYVDSMGGKPTLTATTELMTTNNMTASQQETVVGPYRVMLMPPAQTIIPQNERSQPGTVQLIDSTSMAVKTSSAVTVQLSSSSSTGQFFDALGKLLSNGRLTIPAGSSSASFEYKDSQAGFPTLTVSENGFTDQQHVTVGVSLVYTTPTRNLKAGQPSGIITVQLQDGNGKAFIAPSTLMVALNSNSFSSQFQDSSGNPLLTYLTIPAGASSFSFKYLDNMGGKPTLTAGVSLMSGPWLSATQHETVTGPYRAVFSPVQQAMAIAQNEPSQPITIHLQDSTGMEATATSAVTVQLSSTSATGQFLDASGKPLSNGCLTIPAGCSSATFEYKDSQAGLPALTAAANGFTSPTQVVVGALLVFTTPAQTLKAGQVSQPITVQLQDSHGKAIPTPSDLPITLNSSLSTVEFLNTGWGGIPFSITIPGGSSSASFTISSNWGGKPTLTASVFGTPLSVTQQETIQGLSGVVFTTPPQTLTAGQKSQRMTLQLQDNNGKAAVAPSGGLTIYLSGNSTPIQLNPTVQFFDANGNPIPPSGTYPFLSTAIFMPAGSSTVSFEFETTQTGSFPLFALLSYGPSTKQVETIQAGPPHSLVFQTPAQTLATGAPSGTITIQLQDQYGNPVTAGSGGMPFNLHSSSRSGTFLSADGEPLAGSTITVPQGLSSATFEYKDSQVGTPTLTVSARGLSASQKESISPVSAEIHVTNTIDSGSGSLRAAIEAANANPGSTIVFDSGVRGTIDLLSELPTITANTNILGPGANLLTIERSAAATTDFGIFNVGTSITAQPVVVMSGLTVANATGTAITNLGYLTLQRMVVKNNQAPASSWPSMGVFPYGSPGGISNFGTLTVLNSTIANNSTTSAPSAAGIESSGSLLILNSTITGNKGVNSNRTGGIGIYGGTALIENSTISGNTAGQFSSAGGGVDSDGNVVLYDTLVAGNTGSLMNPTDVSGAFLSLGHNLIGEANQLSSGFVTSDFVGTIAKSINPKLGPLANNGGPTPTMALLTGSPAIGTGSSFFALATDQRGDPRPHGAIDIGAFERTTS
jgi:hypothetical protein